MGSGALWWLCLAALLGPLLLCLRGQSAGVVARNSEPDRCEKYQNPPSLTCERCQKGWSGPYCTRENIAYLRARRKQQKINDENLDNCGAMRKKKTLQLSSRLTNDMMIDIHLKETANLTQARNKLNNCSVVDCGEEDWLSDLVLRWNCTASARRNPEDLTIQCNDGKQVKICEIRVYQCAELWWDLENGCNQSCQCQDGANCNPWNGTCPHGKEIQVTTASGASAGAGQSSSTSTSLSSSPTPTTLSSSPTPTTLSSSPTPTTLGSSPTPTTLSSSTTPTTLSSSPTPTTLGSSPTPTTLSSSTTPTTLSSSTTPTTLGSSTSSDAMTDREDEVVTTTLVISTTEEETSEAPTSTLTDEETSPPTAATTPVKSSATPEDKENEDEGGTGEKRTTSTLRTLQMNTQGGSRGNGEGSGSLTGVLGAVGAIVVLVALAVVAGIVYIRRQGAGRPQAEENDGYACVVNMEMNNRTLAPEDDEDENEYGNTLEPFSVTTDPIAVSSFRDHMAHMKMCGGYSKEFQELPRGIHGPATAGMEAAEGSVKKNRFKDILPYDDSRVVLKKEKDSDSDYINASYIDGFDQAMAYIAAQGPLPETLGDFWHMAWTEGCSKIIMLTNLSEGNKIKCERYWPNKEGGCETFGDYAVTCVKVVKKAHFVHRRLSVAKRSTEGGEGQGQSREVQHMHFTAWPDHGVPCPVALVRFWSSIVMLPVQLGGPMLVHCSAGIGRTGTFIALDMLTRQVETTAKVSLFPTVRRLRKQRVNMVQTMSQYVFLHEVVREWLCCREGDLIRSDLLHGSRWKAEEGGSATQLPAAARQQCAAQFQLVEELHPAGSSEMTTAQREENVVKNRSSNILPVEQYRVCLAKCDQSDSDYINAVFLPSLSRAQGYIVTQLPLGNTVADFWCMVRDWRVRTVVRFMDAAQVQVSVYPQRGQTMQHGTINVTTNAVTVVRPGLSLYSLHLQGTRSGKSWGREVSVYCVDSRQAVALRATKVFVTLADILLPLVKSVDAPPIVLQCLDGAGLSCVLCAVLMGIESLQQEERTSPFLLARLIHTAQPQAFTTAEQYEFMVRCLLHHTRGITEEGEGEADTAPDHQQRESDSGHTDEIYANV